MPHWATAALKFRRCQNISIYTIFLILKSLYILLIVFLLNYIFLNLPYNLFVSLCISSLCLSIYLPSYIPYNNCTWMLIYQSQSLTVLSALLQNYIIWLKITSYENRERKKIRRESERGEKERTRYIERMVEKEREINRERVRWSYLIPWYHMKQQGRYREKDRGRESKKK